MLAGGMKEALVLATDCLACLPRGLKVVLTVLRGNSPAQWSESPTALVKKKTKKK